MTPAIVSALGGTSGLIGLLALLALLFYGRNPAVLDPKTFS
jgi:hypothetical protein